MPCVPLQALIHVLILPLAIKRTDLLSLVFSALFNHLLVIHEDGVYERVTEKKLEKNSLHTDESQFPIGFKGRPLCFLFNAAPFSAPRTVKQSETPEGTFPYDIIAS